MAHRNYRSFRSYYQSLDPGEKERFRELAGVSEDYLTVQALRRNPLQRVVPRLDRMIEIYIASQGALTVQDIAQFFIIERMEATIWRRLGVGPAWFEK